MILDKALLLKGLVGTVALAGTGTTAYFAFFNNDPREALLKDLGLPTTEENACKLPTNGSTNCQLDEAKLKKINFDGKGDNEPSIESNGTVTLTITKVDISDSIFGTGGYKFAFESNKDITISSSPAKYIKKNTNTEFKIKETTSTDGGAKTLSLEKAWNITEWGKKVGLTNCSATDGQKQCTFGDKINLFINDSNKTEDGTIESGKKITFEEDQGGHNQGFKFTVSEDISLNGASDDSKKIEKENASYEIKEIEGKWYLAKKTTGGAAS